jgi:hypothetical protein
MLGVGYVHGSTNGFDYIFDLVFGTRSDAVRLSMREVVEEMKV